VLAGEQSTAFRLDSGTARHFVKVEDRTTVERVDAAAELADVAARQEVPAPLPRPTRHGRHAVPVDTLVLSVTEWVPGQTLSPPVSLGQATQIGAALGRLHQAFAALAPPPAAVTAAEEEWLRWDAADVVTRWERAEALVRDRGDDPDGFDRVALAALAERRDWLTALDRVLTGVPPLTRQWVHGDYAAPNLLFDGDRLVAVVDFANASPHLIAYELGRIAFGPEVVLSPHGPTLSATVLDAYVAASPAATEADVAWAEACAFVQLARSTYPVTARYAGTGRFRADLDDFWVRRQDTARLLHARLHPAPDVAT
jgi:homoserine kinase type II